jgi:hypothetical protein
VTNLKINVVKKPSNVLIKMIYVAPWIRKHVMESAFLKMNIAVKEEQPIASTLISAKSIAVILKTDSHGAKRHKIALRLAVLRATTIVTALILALRLEILAAQKVKNTVEAPANALNTVVNTTYTSMKSGATLQILALMNVTAVKMVQELANVLKVT